MPANEEERLHTLHQYRLLDTDPDPQLDDITLLASRICGTPIAMISLIDEGRQWFKSRVGTTLTETPRDLAFCAHGILEAELFVVNDAAKDARFAANPMVTGNPRIRFYAGAPLISPEGHTLGMICVNDQVPRELSTEQTDGLRALGRQVITQFELKRNLLELQRTYTRLKETEDSLRLLGSAVEQSNEAILITDAQLDLPGPAIVFVNSAFTQMTGYSAEEAVGNSPRILQGPRTDRSVLSRLRRNLENDELFEGETVNYHKGGREFHVEWQIAPIRDNKGKTTHFVSIQRNISQKKQLEARLLQSQKLETAGKLSSGVAHEFNSILTTIIGQSELLLSGLPPADPLCQNASEIRNAAGLAATLTRQLLAYGRKQFLQPEILDLNLILHRLGDTVRHLMGRGVEVHIVPSPDVYPVRADAGQIEQVIMNMAMNASDAMPAGGKLILEAINVSLDEAYVTHVPELSAGHYVMLTISDNGCGMSEEVKGRIFEPFFSTKAIGHGTGLGLSSCDGIIKQSGGHIAVQTELTRGTTFRIYLPRVERTADIPIARPGPSEPPRGTETILLVEDDPALREVAPMLLKKLGYTVYPAPDSVAALEMQRNHPGRFHILVTNLTMPDIDGRELADLIRKSCPDLRVLFTAFSDGNRTIHGRAPEERDALLLKPYTPFALAKRVRDTLDGPRTPVGTSEKPWRAGGENIPV